MMFGHGISVNGIENGEIGIAEIIELLPVLAVLGDDGATVHFRPRSRHRKHAADGNPLAGHFPEIVEIILPRVLLAVCGTGYRLAIVADGTAADGKDKIHRLFPCECHALHDLFDRGIGHDARQFDRLFSRFAEFRLYRIVNTVFADGTAAVHQHDLFSVLTQFFTQILQ